MFRNNKKRRKHKRGSNIPKTSSAEGKKKTAWVARQ